jgi:hypothetical protein
MLNCPGCNKELPPSVENNGVTRYYCDCAGVFRPVIEIIPAAVTVTTVAPAHVRTERDNPAKELKINERTN